MQKCVSSSPSFLRDGEAQQHCKSYVKVFVKLLDKASLKMINQGREQYYTVVYKTELLSLLKHRYFQHFVQDLNQTLAQNQAIGVKQISVLKIAQKWFSHDHQTLAVMAAIFQDTSDLAVHLEWLSAQSQLDGIQKENSKQLAEFFSQMLELKKRNKFEFVFVDDWALQLGVSSKQSYHYYVPALAAQKMQQQEVPMWAAMLIPYQFNYLYEILTNPDALSGLLQDAPRIQNHFEAQDIYAGYIGAARAVGYNGNLMPFQVFKDRITTENRLLQVQILKNIEAIY